ncbi:unnamed protein product [Symbiodinium sp. CCMP2592]|nr:unnamed protein product [Symbiodinium sp. CCMP2592]
MSFAGDGQLVRVTRTFLEVVDIVQGSDMGGAVACRSRTMPSLPSLGLDFEASSTEKDEPAAGPALLAQPSSEEHRPDQEQRLTVRVVRTFLEFVPDATDDDKRVNEPLQSVTMPVLPYLGFDLEGEEEASSREEEDEPAAGPAVLAQPSSKQATCHDEDHRLTVRVVRTFLELVSDVTDNDEIANERLKSMTMPLLPILKEVEEEEASSSEKKDEPAAGPAVPSWPSSGGAPERELESRLMMPHSFWAAPLCPGPVEPVHEDPDQVSLQLHSADLQMREVVPQHADRYSGPFPVRMVEQHNSGRCFPCLFFTRRGDGCRQGDRCTHCHVCRPDEIRRRRNRIAAEVKREKKLASAGAKHQHRGLALK